jgi:hypothetical protein
MRFCCDCPENQQSDGETLDYYTKKRLGDRLLIVFTNKAQD